MYFVATLLEHLRVVENTKMTAFNFEIKNTTFFICIFSFLVWDLEYHFHSLPLGLGLVLIFYV